MVELIRKPCTFYRNYDYVNEFQVSVEAVDVVVLRTSATKATCPFGGTRTSVSWFSWLQSTLALSLTAGGLSNLAGRYLG